MADPAEHPSGSLQTEAREDHIRYLESRQREHSEEPPKHGGADRSWWRCMPISDADLWWRVYVEPAAAARREEPVNSGQAQPLDVPGLTALAAEMLRFTEGCEKPHRDGPANPHVHLDITHRWGQRLANLLSSIPEARPAQKHAAWCWLPLDHQGQCEGDQ